MTVTEKLNKELEKKPKAIMTIEDLIKKSSAQLKDALPSHMRPENLVRVALTTLRLNPTLYKCDQMSFLGALFQSAQLGLSPNINGEAWIIPYAVKGVMKAQFQVGAYGYVKMFWNHQNSVSLQMEVVREQDLFEYNLADGTIKHVPPSLIDERGEAVGYYAIAKLKNGGVSSKVMSKPEAMDHAKKYSKCWDKSKQDFKPYTPWKEHFDSMALKTVLIQLMKLLPKSVEIQKAIAMDGTVKSAIDGDMSVVPNEVMQEDYLDVPTENKTDSPPEDSAGEPEFG